MAWMTLERPQHATRVGRPMVSIAVRETKTGKISAALYLANSMVVSYEAFKGVIVNVGTDENAGQLQVQFTKDEATFKLGKGPAQTGIISLVPFAGMPDFKVGSLPCKLLEQAADSFTIELPVAEWQAMRSAKRGMATAPVYGSATLAKRTMIVGRDDLSRESAPHTVSNSTQDVTTKKHDPIAYLTKKGHKIAKLAGVHWQLDGERVTQEAVVMLINKYRAKESLKTITAFDLIDPLST